MFIKCIVAFIVSIFSGFIGAWAGAEGTDKNWRRVGVPLLITLSVMIISIFNWQLKNLLFIMLMSLAGALSLGYGIPDADYPENPDADGGSSIGHFWWSIFNKNEKLANIFTRGTIGLVEAFVVLLLPLVTHNWLLYAIFAPLIVFNNIMWGAIVKNEGMYRIFGKNLLWEEHLIYQILYLLIVFLSILSL